MCGGGGGMTGWNKPRYGDLDMNKVIPCAMLVKPGNSPTTKPELLVRLSALWNLKVTTHSGS